MTFEEAKKILEEEGFYVEKATVPCVLNGWFIKYESPEICEAVQVVYSAGYKVLMFETAFQARKERLKKEYEKNTKAPAPGEEQPKEDNPALAESASQFNDALLDEQAKEIKRLGKKISKLNGIIHKKNLKIEELRKESSRHLRGKIKMFGENVDLEQMLKDKNAILADVAEELRLTKIREKNLTEVGQKYMKENEELKKELEKMTKLVETVRKGSKEYCEYGIAAEKMIQKMAKEIVNDSPVPSKDYKQYRLWANGYRFNPQLPDFSEEEEKKLEHAKKIRVSSDIADEGGDQSATIVQCDNGIILSKEEAEIVERCTKNGTELHYSEKDGLTYTNMYGEEIPIRCLRGLFHVFTDEELKNMKK